MDLRPIFGGFCILPYVRFQHVVACRVLWFCVAFRVEFCGVLEMILNDFQKDLAKKCISFAKVWKIVF